MNVPSLEVISEEVLEHQYRNFIVKITEMSEGLSVEDLQKLDSREVFKQCCYSAQKVNRCTHFCLKIGAKSVQNNDKIGAKIGATPPFHSRIAIV